MRIAVDSLFDELLKLGAVSDEQARRSLDRLDQLEQNKPTTGQVARYGALGGAAGATMQAVGRAVEGTHGSITPRSLASAAATGAIGMGAMPLIRSALDRHTERKTLKAYLHQPGS